MFAGKPREIVALRLQLGELLTGAVPPDVDWEALLFFANSQHLVPAIFLKLAQHDKLRALPAEVHDYISLIHELNRTRNIQLQEQLLEYAQALNRHGVVPVLTKGAIDLATGPDSSLALRMMYDLDVSVRAEELQAAETALRELGYRPLNGQGWGRPSACGSIDLHYPPSRYREYWPELAGELRPAAIAGVRLSAPSNYLRARHLIIHDMIKDGGWWLLTLNMRSLFDLYELSQSAEGVDWRRLIGTMPDRLTRAAAVAQCRALDHYFQTVTRPVSEPVGLFRHKIRTEQAPSQLIKPLRACGRMSWWMHRAKVEWRNRETVSSLAGRIVRRAMRGRNWP